MDVERSVEKSTQCVELGLIGSMRKVADEVDHNQKGEEKLNQSHRHNEARSASPLGHQVEVKPSQYLQGSGCSEERKKNNSHH